MPFGVWKKQRFIERCTQNDLSYNICECMYTEVSQQIEDTDGFIEWFVAANKKDDTMEDIMRGATYAGLLSNMVHCTLSDTVFNKKFGAMRRHLTKILSRLPKRWQILWIHYDNEKSSFLDSFFVSNRMFS